MQNMQDSEKATIPERIERHPKEGSQAARVLKVLLDANGEWVNFQKFVREMYLTQAHYQIHKLENKYGWDIKHSDFTDEHGFKSYRIVPADQVTRI